MTDIKATLDSLLTAASAVEAEVVALRAENEKLRAGNNNRKKLSRNEVARIRQYWRSSSFTQRDLADAFDVNPATISRTVRGIYHK